jgi:hypothetical protein
MIPKIVFVSFFVSFVCVLIAYIRLRWEQINHWRLKNFNPARIIRCVIHYDSTRTKVYYRLIPSDKTFVIDDMRYHYDKESSIKPEDLFAVLDKKDKKELTFKIDNKEYKYSLLSLEKRSVLFGEDNCLEIHYWFNCPTPINFDVKKRDVVLSAKQMQDMKVNDLFAKLLKLEDQDMMLMIILICVILIIIVLGFNAYFSYNTNKMLADYIKMVSTPVKHAAIIFFVMRCSKK